MTLAEAEAAVEKQLAGQLKSPEVAVRVIGYNSQVYYIVTEGAGLGDKVKRVPVCGNETVLDAIAQIGGLSQLSSKKMWLVRPSATDPDKGKILPIDYDAITRRGATKTNYQLMPGDRLFIAEDETVALNNAVGALLEPVERVLGVMGLGASTISNVRKTLRESPK